MARPLRLEFAGALYHITARGDRREPIYEDDDDRAAFLGLLGEVSQQHSQRQGIAKPLAGTEKSDLHGQRAVRR